MSGEWMYYSFAFPAGLAACWWLFYSTPLWACCLHGPCTPAPIGCVDRFDGDSDGDVDLVDFAAHQNALQGGYQCLLGE